MSAQLLETRIVSLDRSHLASKLAGINLHLHQDKIDFGIPELEAILPSPTLAARLV